MSGPKFAPHADVRNAVSDLYKLASGLNAMGLHAPALTNAMDMLERLSWRVHELEEKPGSTP